ncbi:hypothetical protein TNCT_580031 [Trichonephila clavata]|uniref:Uncharacterized protein n=1 Tax=Trichonephila clavata TaxID=2740835 RepID=A0A8X6LQR5_TRICU|nr:hypothetical protein TNCT_580031 [Trichonephila clavata]
MTLHYGKTGVLSSERINEAVNTTYHRTKLCDLFKSSIFKLLGSEPPQLHQKSLLRVKKQLHDPDISHSWRTSLRAPIPFEVGEGALDILFGRFLSAILVETTTRFQKALPLEGHPAKNEKERTKVLASEGKACEDDTVSPPGVIESRCCLCTPLPLLLHPPKWVRVSACPKAHVLPKPPPR